MKDSFAAPAAPATVRAEDPGILEATARNGGSAGGIATIDTRSSDSVWGRVYAAPFARVWDGLHEEIDARRHWAVVHSDEELGLVTAVCRSWLPWDVSHLTVWVRLDEYALTRVDTRAWCRAGWTLPGGSHRRVRALVSGLDRRLGGNTRIES